MCPFCGQKRQAYNMNDTSEVIYICDNATCDITSNNNQQPFARNCERDEAHNTNNSLSDLLAASPHQQDSPNMFDLDPFADLTAGFHEGARSGYTTTALQDSSAKRRTSTTHGYSQDSLQGDSVSQPMPVYRDCRPAAMQHTNFLVQVFLRPSSTDPEASRSE